MFTSPELIDNHIRVFQGEREITSHNKLLAEFELVGIPPAPTIDVNHVEVTLAIDANGVLTVSAKDVKTTSGSNGSKKIQITIPPSSRELSDDVIEKMVKEGESHAKKDKAMKDLIEIKNDAEIYLYCEEKELKEYRKKIPAHVATEMESAVADMRNAMRKDNYDEIEKRFFAVSDAFCEIKMKVEGGEAFEADCKLRSR